MRSRSTGLLLLIPLLCAAGVQGAENKLNLPLGLQESAAFIPDDNPITPEKVALGKKFFWDKRWSTSGTVACVNCHPPDHGWSDPNRFSTMFSGKQTPRHAPTIVNRLFSDQQLWTGLRPTLEEQALKDANRTDELVVKHFGGVPAYQEEFRKVFGKDLDADGVAKAISAYVRTILSGNSAYDRFQAGDKNALSPAAQRGMTLFSGKAHCAACHAGFNFTDEGYHNIGVGMDKQDPDLGRYTATKRDGDQGAFKTPTLREASKRGPYMHDGGEGTLAQVVAFYNKGGVKNTWLSKEIQPLNLTDQEQADLVVFLQSLAGEVAPEVSSPPQLPE